MLGGETSGSEQKDVMQWTGFELKAKLKWRRVLNKTARLKILKKCLFTIYMLRAINGLIIVSAMQQDVKFEVF